MFNLFGLQIGVSEIVILGGLSFGAVVAWNNVKNMVGSNKEKIGNLESAINNLVIKVNAHEREVGITTANFNTIQSQILGISNRLDTLINHLLRDGKDDK